MPVVHNYVQRTRFAVQNAEQVQKTPDNWANHKYVGTQETTLHQLKNPHNFSIAQYSTNKLINHG